MLIRTRSGKPDAWEAYVIEGDVIPNIKDKYSLTVKTSPVDYADMLRNNKNMQRKK